MTNKLHNQAAIFFMSANMQPGLDTLPPPNHCFMLMRLEGGVMYVNPSVNGVVTRFKFGEGYFGRLRKRSPEAGRNLESSLQCTINPIFDRMWDFQNQAEYLNKWRIERKLAKKARHKLNTTPIDKPSTFDELRNSPYYKASGKAFYYSGRENQAKKKYEKSKKMPHCFLDLEIPQTDNPKLKPKHSNVIDTLELNHQYYSLIERYIKLLKPITVVDVGVYQFPTYQPLIYGRPMHCHNYIIHTLGLDIGNILTTRHFQDRLLNWDSKTNFCSTILYQRELLKSDWASPSKNCSNGTNWSFFDRGLNYRCEDS